MTHALFKLLAKETGKLEQAGLHKRELTDSAAAIDFTGHDYLGLSEHTEVREAAKRSMTARGHAPRAAGVLAGAAPEHRALERKLAEFLGLGDALLFGAGYLANVGLFTSLFDNRDAIFCDAWVHPSVADGIRLSSARAVPYLNDDLASLEDKLKRSKEARFRAVVTDGVFPFTGQVARLHEICDLAERYDALVIVDDSLGVGVLGESGRGASEHRHALDRVHVLTGTFTKVLGGGAGGYVAGSEEVVEWLRQKSAARLFSAKLAPPMCAAADAALDLVRSGRAPSDILRERFMGLHRGLSDRGFQMIGGEHPLLVVIVGDVAAVQQMVNHLFKDGVHVHGLCYPVVPEREARIQIQVSALHTTAQVDQAIDAFERAGRNAGVL